MGTIAESSKEEEKEEITNGELLINNNNKTRLSRKRKSDVLDRMVSSATSGRGRDAGWTQCPLCGCVSSKYYCLGRGIAEHLHAVHTPWKPGKLERKRRRKLGDKNNVHCIHETWDPTPQEMANWNAKVDTILKTLQEQSSHDTTTTASSSSIIPAGRDRNGKKQCSYRDSLPEFLQAAAKGNLAQIQKLLSQQPSMLQTLDRHGSTAGHWAAGGGHLDVLRYLMEQSSSSSDKEPSTKLLRRRDGKTCLHYAARYGRLDCVQYLVQEQQQCETVDVPSGDGTTPLHLACFGGHLETAQFLVEHCGANPQLVNDWNCNAAHWHAMSREPNLELCNYLYDKCGGGASLFVAIQKQGHSPVHKAAQKKNTIIIEWMAKRLSLDDRKRVGQPDQGGHRPSDIWTSVGGNAEFADKMKTEWNW